MTSLSSPQSQVSMKTIETGNINTCAAACAQTMVTRCIVKNVYSAAVANKNITDMLDMLQLCS